MTFFSHRNCRDCLIVAVTLLAIGRPTAAQDVTELQQLLDRFGKTLNAEQYDEAERQAQYLLGVAEKNLRAHPKVLAGFYEVVGDLYYKQDRYQDAERYYAREVKLREAALGHWNAEVAVALHAQGDAVYYQDKFPQAAALYRQALEIRQRVLGQNHLETATSWRELGYTFYMAKEYDKAWQCTEQALAIRRRLLGAEDPLVADTIRELANIRYFQRRYEEALPLYDQALTVREKALGKVDLDVAQSLVDRGDCLKELVRVADAEADYRRAVEIRDELAPDDEDTAAALRSLAGALVSLAQYDEADGLYKRALAIDEPLDAGSYAVARSLDGLARIKQNQGRYAEAEPLYRRSLAIREQLTSGDPLALAIACNNLGTLYLELGRYADAERLGRKALAIREEHLPADDPEIATSLNNLGVVLRRQGRNQEAEPYYRRALEIREAQLPATHPDLASSLQNVANLQMALGDFTQAEQLYRRALEIYKKAYGENHIDVANCTSVLANAYWQQGRKADAQALYVDVLKTLEEQLGGAHPDLAGALYDLAWCYFYGDEEERAQELLDRAVDVDRQFPLSPQTAFNIYSFRARVHRYLGRKSEATRDLEHAMELAEQLRGSSAGAELERADFFATFSSAFETMVEWQMEDGDVERALAAIERSRARSLLDEISLAGADLDAGRPVIEEAQNREADAQLRSELTELERELQKLLAQPDPPAGERERLTEAIATTREKVYQQYRDARSSSVIYQNLLNRTAKLPALGEIQRQLLKNGGLLFAYFLGEKNGYLVVLSADSANLYSLAISDDDAQTLGCEPGPLTAERLQQALLAENGVMPQLASAKPATELEAKLSALWSVLIPEESRQELISDKWSRLIVVPNGPLAFLPFEAFVTSTGDGAKYFLDAGPPIYYAPSVMVLDSLRIRPALALPADREPILTVGDPRYGDNDLQAQAARSVLIRGQLSRLPNSGLESRWVSEIFDRDHVKSVRLVEADATEANVTEAAPSRKLIHLACHGLTDQAHGNLFGALALTPGANPDEETHDDGFLSLGEIYDLKLRGCELAILSACETNYGPEQRGEGVWSLSRGFLVAGTRRVVASNWVVDDEATANLVSYFCGGLAKAQAAGDEHAYGKSLLAAKRHIRQQEKWQAPYYWASMVLIGPP